MIFSLFGLFRESLYCFPYSLVWLSRLSLLGSSFVRVLFSFSLAQCVSSNHLADSLACFHCDLHFGAIHFEHLFGQTIRLLFDLLAWCLKICFEAQIGLKTGLKTIFEDKLKVLASLICFDCFHLNLGRKLVSFQGED